MTLESEINRLLDMMPASGRMLTKIISKPQQSKTIDTPFPMPWHRDNRPIYINFDLWRRLSRPERDMLILRAASILTAIKWFQPDIYQGIVLAGMAGVVVELIQADAVGIIIAGSLSAIAANQIWRSNRSVQRELDADAAAIKVALRRGYSESEAAQNLASAIKAVAEIEGRPSLNFTELIRCQNLQAIATGSPVGVPETIKNSE